MVNTTSPVRLIRGDPSWFQNERRYRMNFSNAASNSKRHGTKTHTNSTLQQDINARLATKKQQKKTELCCKTSQDAKISHLVTSIAQPGFSNLVIFTAIWQLVPLAPDTLTRCRQFRCEES
jgi:hypothetical protein